MNTYMQRPQIIKETSNGKFSQNIEDEMFANRTIQCLGKIEDYTSNLLINQLLYLEKDNPDAEIVMYINSPGGSVDAGMALYDVMQYIKCPIRTVCIGLAASMGAILFMSGNSREMLPHSRVMIHDPLIDSIGGNALSIKSISDDLMKTREIIANIIAKHTGKSIKAVYQCTMQDTFFRAQEAIKFGLADKIVTKTN